MIELIVAAQLSLAQLAQPSVPIADWLLKRVEQKLGVQNFRRRTSGAAVCASPTNFLAAARHTYFFKDSSWAVAGDPDDEAGGTDQALETSTDLTEGDDLVTTGLPPGSPSGAVKVILDSTEIATSASDLTHSSDRADYQVVKWINRNGGTDGEIYRADNGGFDFFIIYIDGSDQVVFATALGTGPGNDTDCVGTATLPNTTDWHQVLVHSNNEGTGAADDVEIWVDGVQAANCSQVDDAFAGMPQGARFGGGTRETYDMHELMMFGPTLLTTTEIMELCCCGADGTADPSAREAICGGAGGSSCSGF